MASVVPCALSEGEEEMAQHLEIYRIPFAREVVFSTGRKWRFDFLICQGDKKVAVEVEGGTAFGRSRHSKGKGFEEDCRKYNHAALLGCTVLRFTTAMVHSGEAIDTIREALK